MLMMFPGWTKIALGILASECPTMMLHWENDEWCLHISEDEPTAYKGTELDDVIAEALTEVAKRKHLASMN